MLDWQADGGKDRDRSGWDANACEWARRVCSGMDLSRTILLAPTMRSLFQKLVMSSLILDLGCGSEPIGSVLDVSPSRVVSIDYSLGMCREWKDRSPASENIVCGDATGLPFKDATFAGVIANMVLHCVDDLDRVCAELSRVLAPNGMLMFSTLHSARVMPYYGHGASFVGMVKDYGAERRMAAHLKVGDTTYLPAPITYHHRMISSYTEALRAHSFIIVDIREPVASPEAMANHPRMRHFWELVPFIFWLARKNETISGFLNDEI